MALAEGFRGQILFQVESSRYGGGPPLIVKESKYHK
ncbi:uncharacterized protein G2W53_012923 [Senna tora]|uniref:Uncharacterized protein n=1 Tax=Senna tora TaxID=362788 RepID=A0A834U1W0_9FABA|nr:uncharacterized protein G2W53_012923 [Senna tora]